MSEEIWKPVVGYESFYEISNLGNIRSKDRKVFNGNGYYIKKGKMLSKTKTTTGYWKVEIVNGESIKKSKKVHRLVAMAFIENPSKKPFINHIDGDPLNNDVSNLEWCDQSENMQHAYLTGLKKCGFHENKEKILYEYTHNDKTTMRGLAKKYGCSEATIKKFLERRCIDIRTISEIQDKYNIDKRNLILDFKNGLKNKEIAKKYKTNKSLIATYRYKYRKGELA